VAPGQSSAGAIRELRECLERFAARHRSVEIRAGVYARGRGTLTPPDHPLVTSAVDVLRDELGLAAGPFPPGAADSTNDTSIFRQHAIPSIKLGPSDRFDTVPETAASAMHVTIADLTAATRLYTGLARRLVSQGANA
jgi:acetylornithine deacetylase/succinyl-diaminopimelate desuccinylase-like protein